MWLHPALDGLCVDDGTREVPGTLNGSGRVARVEDAHGELAGRWLRAGCLPLPILTLNAREIDCRRTRLMIVPPPFPEG